MRVVGIQFRPGGIIYDFDSGSLALKVGEKVIVKTEKGLGIGTVVRELVNMEYTEPDHSLKKVIRKAGEIDLEKARQNSQLELEAKQFCRKRIESRDLKMKLVDVEYLYDGSKIIFYFTANGRVDFRELVRDLVRQFHTRIEMRQIGVRNEAKMLGGIGACGRELCCSLFLKNFKPVSVRMAKDQNLSLNPGMISGVCGRLMCCLAYEHDTYAEAKKDMPKCGRRVKTTRGDGEVLRINLLQGKLLIRLESGEEIEVLTDEIGEETEKKN
ncbi:MAG: stage 0 sporulation family protein [Deltaproteobacteria bacterium]|nr:stage 0 sporulation family protein [Deltaproteobacteria bacterium]MBW2307512.1 stage 0 sporulation family protein [Deltaproteobacteria bacterium]